MMIVASLLGKQPTAIASLACVTAEAWAMQRQLSTGDVPRRTGAATSSSGSATASKRRARDLLRDYYSLSTPGAAKSQEPGNPLDMGTVWLR